ncbi:hypothetical protein [Veillonella seminalis]|jgi:hypothetical protein|nr:hypothetical protein [Veillonella seminalis]
MSREIMIKDKSIEEARAEIHFTRKMNACPIDFSPFQSSNPRENRTRQFLNRFLGQWEDYVI